MRLSTIVIGLFLFVFSVPSFSHELTEIEKTCMAKALYHEARGETDRGMFAVASVILNRKHNEKFPDDACSVISQKGQFTYDHKAKIKEWNAWDKVKSVVNAMSEGFSPSHSFIYFHSVKVVGQCTIKKNKIKIGNHYFC